MARYSSKDCILLLDGFNVMGRSTELTSSVEAVTEESTPYGAEWEEHFYVGINRAEISQNGFYDDASASINEALNEKQGESRILCFGFEGNTIGKQFAGVEGAMQTNFERVASMGELHKANASYNGNGEVEDGRIIHALVEREADGDTESSSVDNGAESTDGAYLYLQVPALTLGGYDDITITVRDSADGSSWADLESFTAVTAAQTVERIFKSGTIRRYLAVSWEFTGVGSDPSATFFVGVVRK
jgi:hypothetical protein